MTAKTLRDWIHVTDHARGIVTVALKGKTGQAYNMGGDAEKMNIEIVKLILFSHEQTRKPYKICPRTGQAMILDMLWTFQR